MENNYLTIGEINSLEYIYRINEEMIINTVPDKKKLGHIRYTKVTASKPNNLYLWKW